MSAYRILVAIDLKPGTERLLAEAQRYAKALDAIVDIIHVADPDPILSVTSRARNNPKPAATR